MMSFVHIYDEKDDHDVEDDDDVIGDDDDDDDDNKATNNCGDNEREWMVNECDDDDKRLNKMNDVTSVSSGDVVRAGSLNVELSFGRHKAATLGSWAARLRLSVVGLQEIGQPAMGTVADTMKRYGYSMVAATLPFDRRGGGGAGVGSGAGGAGGRLGVAVLLDSSLTARIVRIYRCPSARLVGVVVDAGGCLTLIGSCYMPTGLDFVENSGNGADKLQEARRIYSLFTSWCSKPLGRGRSVTRALLLGDMNETRSSIDRVRGVDIAQRAPHHDRCISQLIDAGFVDCYRARHDRGGYTCSIVKDRESARKSYSRIDYVFARGWGGSECVTRALTSRVPLTTAHRAVVVALRGGWGAIPIYNTVRPRLPQLSRATPLQQQRCVDAMVRFLDRREHQQLLSSVQRLATTAAADAAEATVVQQFGDVLIEGAQAAVRMLPHSGSRSYQQNARQQQQQQQQQQQKRRRQPRLADTAVRISCRREHDLAALRRLLRAAAAAVAAGDVDMQQDIFMQYPPLSQLLQRVGYDASAESEQLPLLAWSSLQQWSAAIQRELSRARFLSAAAVRKSRRAARAATGSAEDQLWKNGPAAAVERMMRGGGSADITSIIDPSTEQLVYHPRDVKRVLHDHFKQQLTQLSGSDSYRNTVGGVPAWVQSMYALKPGIDRSWYDTLMQPLSDREMDALLGSITGAGTSPGEDRIASNVWRLFATQSQPLRAALHAFISACVVGGIMPAFGKQSIIVPILKNTAAGDRVVSNIRPISLQASLSKLICKVYATRLGAIFATHPILDPAQRGFLPGGDSIRCVEHVADLWTRVRSERSGCYSMFYDIRAAYDSVRHDDLIMSLQRIGLPKRFIQFARDSLTGLTSVVRTAFGNTAPFDVTRSVRQGDPISPLWFIIFMDPLHCGYRTLAWLVLIGAILITAAVLQEASMPLGSTGGRFSSIGFADDTFITASTLYGLWLLHQWTLQWTRWHDMLLHALKTQLVGIAPKSDTLFINESNQPERTISIDGIDIVAKTTDESCKYLGCHMRMDLNTDLQVSAINSIIGRYAHAITRHRVRTDRALIVVNQFMLPALNYSLGVVSPTQAEAKRWDTITARAISIAAGTGGRVIAAHVLYGITGCVFPSLLEECVKLGETHVSLNDSRVAVSALARYHWVHRMARGVPARESRFRRAEVIAQRIGWQWVDAPRSAEGRHTRDSHEVPEEVMIPRSEADTQRVTTINGLSRVLVSGWHGTWGSSFNHELSGGSGSGSNKDISSSSSDGNDSNDQPHVIVLATDGSFIPGDAAGSGGAAAAVGNAGDGWSAWSICVVDDFLQQWYQALPPDESEYHYEKLREVMCISGSIPSSSSTGIYMAELQAVYRALVLLPVGASLRLLIDSRSVIDAIQFHLSGRLFDRARQRSSARPLLQLIVQLIRAKQQRAPGTTVELVWQPAHTSDSSLYAVANRIADYFAKREIGLSRAADASGCVTSGRGGGSGGGSARVAWGAVPAAARAFAPPLITGEQFVGVCERIVVDEAASGRDRVCDSDAKRGGGRDGRRGSNCGIGGTGGGSGGDDVAADDHAWRLVSDDVRRAARRRLQQEWQRRWMESNSQSTFAAAVTAERCREYWRAAVTDQLLVLHSGWLLRALSNTLQFTSLVDVKYCGCNTCIGGGSSRLSSGGESKSELEDSSDSDGKADDDDDDNDDDDNDDDVDDEYSGARGAAAATGAAAVAAAPAPNIGAIDGVLHLVVCERADRLAAQQRMIDAVLLLLRSREWQFSRERGRAHVRSAATAVVSVAAADAGAGARAADRARMQRMARVTLAERVRSAATPAAFAIAWADLQQHQRKQHERQLQLVDLFTDIGLISRSTVSASRAVAATATAAATAVSARASVTLSLLGGFDARDVRSMLDRWAIPSELRVTLLSSLRRILLPAWARIHSTSASASATAMATVVRRA